MERALWLLALWISGIAADVSKWDCSTVVQQDLGRAGSGVVWRQLNCTGSGPGGTHFIGPWTAGPMIFNVIDVNLTAPGVGVTGARADPNATYGLQTLPDMAGQLPNALAGINGGYFWRLDSSGFFDDVCDGKTRSDAERAASADHSNYGIGDALLIVNGELLASNCDLPGFARPTALVLNGSASRIVVQQRGGRLPDTVRNAIASGPNLLSFDGTATVIDIPADDWNVNIWEHSANTAVGLVASTSSPTQENERLVMVTSDGYDGCKEPSCGLVSLAMAYYGKDYLGLTTMMSMDQGGSTTAWVNGQPNDGVVSNSNNSPTPSPRRLFDGLFVTLDPSSA